MTTDPIFMNGEWLYDEVYHQDVDCDSLAAKNNLNTVERQILKACEIASTRRGVYGVKKTLASWKSPRRTM